MQPSKAMHSERVVLQQATGKDRAYSVGLDASITSFGVYFRPIGEGEWYGFTVETTSKAGSDTTRCLAIVDEVIQALQSIAPFIKIAVFEDYGPVNKTAGKITARAEMCGMLKRYFLRELQIPIIYVPPTSLKSYATGNGHAKKEQILEAAAQRGYFPESNDEADAYFAALLGERILQGGRTGVSFTRVNP